MGKKKATARDGATSSSAFGGGFSSPPPPPPSAGRPPPSGGGPRSYGAGSYAAEPGLHVRRERGGIAYLSGLTFGVFVLLSIQLAVGLIPQLLCHWSWAIVTLFGGALCAFRWARADEAVAHLIFWGLLMVHGLCWLALLLVPFYGVLPGTLWSAFGDHGGEHLAMASLGSVPLLLAPPTLLLLFMWFEREWLVVIYHDFFHAMGGPWFNISYQLLSPLLPLALWTAALRPPVFSDLPQWPGTPAVVVACMVANVRASHAARRPRAPPPPHARCRVAAEAS